jgi:hypothetical protein
VVRALALVTVRQHQDQRGPLSPLLLRGGDELVDDGLCTVDEVAELRLPQDQRIRPLNGVAVLEAHGRVFRKQGVIDPQLCLVVGKVAQGQPFLAVGAVVEHGVALHERAAAGILPRQAHGDTLHDE